MSAPVFLAASESLREGRHVSLAGPEGHHAAVVRRLRTGEPVDLTDGAGLLVRGVVVSATRSGVSVEVVERRTVPPSDPRVVVVQALPKGERGERAVEAMTEVGVDEIVPWSAARCVTVWRDDRAAKGLGRWRAAARESAKQSRRWWHPQVADLASTASVLERVRGAGLAVVLHESASEPLARVRVPETGELLLVVGPEGGLTDDELTALVAAGAHPARLGPTVLRTSTAGVVGAAVLLARTPRWGGPG